MEPAAIPDPGALLPAAPSAAPKKPPLAISSSLGTLDLLTETQEAALQACEARVTKGWQSFVDVGLALATIRDQRLYRNDFDSFEEYCRARWEFERTKAYGLISAAQVYKNLETLPDIPKPDHESQVRPLIGLTPGAAQLAWQCAVASSRDGRVPARLVKRALKELQLTGSVEPEPKPTRQQRYDQRQSIRGAFQELLTLLIGRAEHDVLIGKVQALQSQIEPLLGVKKLKV